MTTPRKPAWWQLYVLVPVMGGLMLLAYHVALPPLWRAGVHVSILIFIYGLVWRWLRANMYALMSRPTLAHYHAHNPTVLANWTDHRVDSTLGAVHRVHPCPNSSFGLEAALCRDRSRDIDAAIVNTDDPASIR